MKRITLLLFALLPLPCAGDVLHLKNGGKVEGKIVGEEGDAYRVEVATGVVRVAKADVTRIEYGPSPAEELKARRAKLDRSDAKGVVALARWADEKGFHDEALEITRSCDAPECRECVLALIEPVVRTRLAEAQKVLKLGLLRRGRSMLEAVAAKYPEARDRALALMPKAEAPRGRYEGVLEIKDAERLKRVEVAINAWFASGAPVKEEAPLAEYVAVIRRGARGADAPEPGTHRRKTPEGVPYLLRVPAKVDPERLMRLLITLHGSGSGGLAPAALAAWGDSLREEKDLLVVAPDGGTAGWGNARAGHERVLSVLRDVASNFPVDLDRVYLDGASMGGHGSFFLAMYHPDRWAAIAPRVGSARFINMTAKGGVPDLSPAPAMLDNLWATPVFFVAGAKDENSPIDEVRITMRRLEGMGAPLIYREHEGGHSWYSEEDPDVLDFLRSHVRDPYPKRVKFATRDPAFGRCSWIEIVEATRPLRIEITHLDMLGQPLETRKEYDKPVDVDAQIDREKNRINVKASGVKTLRVWLADELVDLDKELEVVVNDARLFQGKVERSLQTALEDCRKRGDRGAPFVASVTVNATR